MSAIAWQKSSFSGSGGNSGCLELATGEDRLLFRESDEPEAVLAARTLRVAALLHAIKGGGWQRRR